MKSIQNAISQIDNMADLNAVIKAVKQKRKSLQLQLNRNARATFRVGDTVICNSKAGKEKAIIMDIRRSWATITINGTRYNAPLSILEVA